MRLVFRVTFSVETEERFVDCVVVLLSRNAREAISAGEKKLRVIFKKDRAEKVVRMIPISVEKIAELS